MTSSREDPEILPDAEFEANLPAGYPDNPPVRDPIDQTLPLFDCVALDKLCQVAEIFQDRERSRIREEEIAETRRRLAEERAERHRQYVFEVAKAYALELHSDQITPKQSKDDEEEEEVKKVKGKSRFDDAKNAIKKRRRYSRRSSSVVASTPMELSMTAKKTAPMLTELCMRALAKNSEAIKSLYLVPDHLKKKISSLVSDASKVDKAFVQLLVDDSPSEVNVKNCVDLEENDLTQILCECDRVSLEVVSKPLWFFKFL